MRISDWSSDVCSSDLLPAPVPPTFQNERRSARWRVHQSPAAENGLCFPPDPRRQAPSTEPPARPSAAHAGPPPDHGWDASSAADGVRTYSVDKISRHTTPRTIAAHQQTTHTADI